MLEQTRHQEFPWGVMEWLAEGEDVGVSLARMMVNAGQTSPAHRHSNCNEVIHVVQGAPVQRVGERWVSMRPGDTIMIRSGEMHQTRNDSDTAAEMVIAYSSGERAYEEVAE